MNKCISYLIIFFFVYGCSHEPIFSGKEVSFGIKNVKFDKNNKIEARIDKILNNYKDLKNKNKIIDLEISSKLNKTVTSKDKNGDPESYKLELIVETKVKENSKTINSSIFNKSHNYNNRSNKFDLKNFENSTIDGFTDIIAEEILVYLLSI